MVVAIDIICDDRHRAPAVGLAAGTAHSLAGIARKNYSVRGGIVTNESLNASWES